MLGFRYEIREFLDEIYKRKSNYEIAFYFHDLTTGAWIGYNERTKFTPASLMKVQILIALLKEAEKVPKLLERTTNFREEWNAPATNEDEFQFKVGVDYSLGELAEIMIQYSDNSAAMMIINYIGLDKVKAVESDLRFGTENENDGEKRTIGVKSYASIFRILYNASYLSKASSEQALEILMTPRYKFGIRRAIPTEIPVAHKFGIRELISDDGKIVAVEQLHDFALVYREGKPYLLGIMIKGDNRELMERIIFELAQKVDGEISKRIDQIKAENIQSDTR